MVPQPFSRFGLRRARIAGLGLGILSLISVSCQSVPLLAPSGSTLTLIPAANELGVGGSIGITATVLEGASSGTSTAPAVGQPVHDGTTITFTTTIGTIQPATAKTTNGQVTVQLVGDGRSGVATVTAISGAATASKTINVGAAAATRISVTATPQSLPAGGGTTSVAASVQNAAGGGLAGVPVGFSTSAGTLASTSVVTDANGLATTSLTTALAATVTATAAGSAAAGLSGTVGITLNPKTNVAVTAPTGSVTVSAPASIGIAVTSSATGATPVITAMHVDFGDGQQKDLATNTASTVHFYSGSGVFTVTVSVTDSTGTQSSGSVSVPVGPLNATVALAPSTVITANATTVTLTATPSNTAAFIDHYDFDFGDGSPLQTSSSASSSHIYAAAGSYTATVKLVPSFGSPIVVPVAVKVS
jgi:adhesin/invasin